MKGLEERLEESEDEICALRNSLNNALELIQTLASASVLQNGATLTTQILDKAEASKEAK